MIVKKNAKFVKREIAVACELIDSLDGAQECECQHRETKVIKRALDAYVLHLGAGSSSPLIPSRGNKH
jgi:hypothetical protein